MAMVQRWATHTRFPVAEPVQPERTDARTTRRIRSVKVAAMNWRIALTPAGCRPQPVWRYHEIKTGQDPQKLPAGQKRHGGVLSHEQKAGRISRMRDRGCRRGCTEAIPFSDRHGSIPDPIIFAGTEILRREIEIPFSMVVKEVMTRLFASLRRE